MCIHVCIFTSLKRGQNTSPQSHFFPVTFYFKIAQDDPVLSAWFLQQDLGSNIKGEGLLWFGSAPARAHTSPTRCSMESLHSSIWYSVGRRVRGTGPRSSPRWFCLLLLFPSEDQESPWTVKTTLTAVTGMLIDPSKRKWLQALWTVSHPLATHRQLGFTKIKEPAGTSWVTL